MLLVGFESFIGMEAKIGNHTIPDCGRSFTLVLYKHRSRSVPIFASMPEYNAGSDLTDGYLDHHLSLVSYRYR